MTKGRSRAFVREALSWHDHVSKLTEAKREGHVEVCAAQELAYAPV